MDKYTTEIIDDLRGCERTLKALETEDEDVVIDIRAKVGYIAATVPFVIKKDTPFARAFVSLLKSEAFILKRELKRNLNIADIVHYGDND